MQKLTRPIVKPSATSSALSPGMDPGSPWPLGAHWDGHGVNFAVFSAHAQALEVCLFDAAGTYEVARMRLPSHTNDVWHGYLPDAKPGLVYGLRAHGPWRPDKGHRFNPAKLLLDPYARDIVGQFEWRDGHFAHDRNFPLALNAHDNAEYALKARVLADDIGRVGDTFAPLRPANPVVYELHVKGFSKLNPRVPEALRGTYAGLAHEASITHLRQLGITTVSLMPVHFSLDEERLATLGLHNYWGYNTLGFFCPDPRLASGCNGLSPRDEFRQMASALNAAGIAVLLDVVFNHSAESDEHGPHLSFRGLDNASYYRLRADSSAHYDNYSGCGNTLDIRHPRVLQLVMDSLRFWASDMHVDGFRFDLAPVLGRGQGVADPNDFGPHSAFFTAVAQDPVLSRVTMVAEPWDLGPGGYQLGNFPRGWLEWNDQFRDTQRRFWLHGPSANATRGDFALRLCGSSDIYQKYQRAPTDSVNYVASHDGFTLQDLVSFNNRHNLANLEGNRDGHGHNLSVNCGHEGRSDDAAVNGLRGRLQRALLATTLLAQGTPMLCAGSELGHSQRGNNNPYCQDNDISWIDWAAADADLLAFTQRLLKLRLTLLPFDKHWYSGLTDPLGLHDLAWLQSDGTPLQGDAWQNPATRVMGCLIGKPGRSKAPLLLLANPEPHDQAFMLPAGVWQGVLDSSHPRGESRWHGQGEVHLPLPAHSLLLLAVAGADVGGI